MDYEHELKRLLGAVTQHLRSERSLAGKAVLLNAVAYYDSHKDLDWNAEDDDEAKG